MHTTVQILFVALTALLVVPAPAQSPRPLPTNSLAFHLQSLGRAVANDEREVIKAALPLMQRHQVRTDYPLTSIRHDDKAKEWVLVFDSRHPDGAFTVFLLGKDADWFEMQPTFPKSRVRFPPERQRR
jgi:hypothetical protein